jgi:hypothetical protein
MGAGLTQNTEVTYMTDKANAASRAEQAAENAAKNATQGETSSLQDFVAGLLPKVDSSNKQAKDNASSEALENSGKRSEKLGEIFDKKLHIQDSQIVGPDEKGIIKLQTGDTLVRAGGMEVLVTKGGGSVVVKPDGSYEASGGSVKHNAKTGETTIDFGNGRSATIRDGKIESVTNGDTTAYMVENKRKTEWIKPDNSIPLGPYPYYENLKPNHKDPIGGKENSGSNSVPKEMLNDIQNVLPKKFEK